MNINEKLKKIDKNHYKILIQIGKVAQSKGLKAYLVGGMVRDILLGLDSLDIDIAVEADAIKLAKELELESENCSVKAIYENFNTAKVSFVYADKKIEVDLTTTREETYEEPAALPKVKISTLEKDLIRRDFTINALAVSITPSEFGEVIDKYGGLDDLKNKLISILPNEKSFIDDPTRMIRAVRFATRFNCRIEEKTQKLFEEAIGSAQFDNLIDRVRGDRVRIELEYLFNLENIEDAISIFYDSKICNLLSLSVADNKNAVLEIVKISKKFVNPSNERWLVWLGIILFRADISNTLTMLHLTSKQISCINKSISAWLFLCNYEKSVELTNLTVYKQLHSLEGVSFLILRARATIDEQVNGWINKYMTELSKVRLQITGEDMMPIGYSEGKQIGDGLDYVLKLMLDKPDEIYDKKKQLTIAEEYLKLLKTS